MNKQQFAAAVLGSILAAATTAPVFAADGAGKEKCFGVAKAGQNDCAAGSHSCAGQSKVDLDKSEWKYVTKGSCEKLGGQLTAAKDKAGDTKDSKLDKKG